MEHILTPYLEQVKAGPPVSFGGLTAFPLDAPESDEPDYVILDDAIAAGTLTISEISEAGAVPTIRVENAGAKPVLILDGEELVGAKQNRMVNLTILVPARSSIEIPVSCVEAGRWHMSEAVFGTAERTAYPELRREKMERLTRNLRACGSRAADQGKVWEEIAHKSARMGVHSPTGAMADIFEHAAPQVEEYVERLAPAARGAGIAFAIGDCLVGLDLFSRRDVLARLYPKLMRSYALDALDRGAWSASRDAGLPPREAVAAFLAELATGTEAISAPAVGEGMDVRLTGPRVTGAALLVDGRPVHICAFRRKDAAHDGAPGEDRHGGRGEHEPPSARLARARARRSHLFGRG